MIVDNVTFGIITTNAYQNKCVHVNEKGYMISIGNQEIFVVPIENYPLQNLVYIEPIVTTKGNYSHDPKAIPTKF
jgi:hypothetical protein